MRNRTLIGLSLPLALAVAIVVPEATGAPRQSVAAVSSAAEAPQDAEFRFLGPDLEPVPLTDEQLLDFLRTAKVIERTRINIGINGIDRLTLEQDGIRLRAGFRRVDVTAKNRRVGAEFYLLFRDSYSFECAAYELARLLGISNVPPAVLRRINGVDGSLQVWVEDLFGDDDDSRAPNALGWARQIWTMKFFDALIYNVDRNPGNVKVDRQYRLWLIDHTRAFQRKAGLFQIEDAGRVDREVWQRLNALDRSDFDRAFAGVLESAEIRFFMDRRAALIEHIDGLIVERGEAAVLY